MEEELEERKLLQRKRIRGLLIILDITLFIMLVCDVVKLIQSWW